MAKPNSRTANQRSGANYRASTSSTADLRKDRLQRPIISSASSSCSLGLLVRCQTNEPTRSILCGRLLVVRNARLAFVQTRMQIHDQQLDSTSATAAAAAAAAERGEKQKENKQTSLSNCCCSNCITKCAFNCAAATTSNQYLAPLVGSSRRRGARSPTSSSPVCCSRLFFLLRSSRNDRASLSAAEYRLARIN